MKRSYPFFLDNPPGPSFNFKYPAFVAPMRLDEPASCGNGGSFNLEPRNPKLRLASCHIFALFILYWYVFVHKFFILCHIQRRPFMFTFHFGVVFKE